VEDSSRAQSVRNPPRSRKFIAGASVLFVISTLINAHLNGHLNTIFLKAILSEVLNPDGKTLQFRCLAALATKFIDNICIKKTVFRQK